MTINTSAHKGIELPYQQEALALVEALGSDAARGLSGDAARERLARYGPNELQAAAAEPWWRRLIEQFEDTLVIILLIATLISFVEWWLQSPRETPLPYEGIVILAIVILNALLGFFQESRAEEAVQALKSLAAPESTVLRDGLRQRVPARELVPGDLILIESGDRVPADARLIEAANLKVDEAALTGESLPVSKRAARIEGEAGLGDRINMLFAATTVTFGRGRALVVGTGMSSEVGRIAGLLETAVKEQTPLQQELDRTGKRLSVIMLAICAIVFLTGIFVNGVTELGGILRLFLFAVALAVAAIPEALPAIVTAGLAMGVRRMAAAHAIIRKLPAVETLGAATVICTDKTGTLTRNEMTVRKIFTADLMVDVEGSGYEPVGRLSAAGQPLGQLPPEVRGDVERTLRAAALANDADLVQKDGRWAIQGDPTEGALIVAAAKWQIADSSLQVEPDTGSIDHRPSTLYNPMRERFPRVGEIPFTSERKRHTTVHADQQHPDQLRVFVKGAPDVILKLCASIRSGDRIVALTDERRAEILRRNEELAIKELRTLAMAERILGARDLGLGIESDRPASPNFNEAEVERDLVFLGIAGMIDPPRPEAQAAVATARQAGIRTVMITGDHPGTAAAIARELGILSEGGRTLRGADLAAMSDAELDRIVEQVEVYARVDPEHKLRIVESWQRRGHVVAMTGDGINDAPALRTANIGIAMGITGTDVSKEAADMVLTDDNFASIVRAVEEGRGIFDNIRKYLYYLLSCNAGELLTMFVGVMLAGALGIVGVKDAEFLLPLLASQLLWINLITDGPPALALGLDPKDPDIMERPPRRQGGGIITAGGWLMIVGVGVILMLGTLFVLDAYYPGGLFDIFVRYPNDLELAERHARTAAFTTLVLFQMFNVFNNRSPTRTAFTRAYFNPLLWAAVILSVLLQVAVVYVPPLQRAFQTTALSLLDWLVALAVASSVLIVVEIAKLVLWRGGATSNGRRVAVALVE
ncbi:MAG: cation-translocating P-type ATPase [Kouleothrix sp.]|nr:cation-translocating P-type ATPase [Kouleothrix sp.]